MRLMLDTNALLWWFREGSPLDAEVRAMIEDAYNEVVVSAAAIWEVGIKHAKGRLEMPKDLLVMLDVQEVEIVDITALHAESAAALPMHHEDPFDRVMVAQALHEDYVLVTADRQLAAYGVEVLAAR